MDTISRRLAATLGAIALVIAGLVGLAPQASAGNVPSLVQDIAGNTVTVDYNLGQGPYQVLYEKIGPKDPWQSNSGDDVDRFKAYDKRCVVLTNPVPGMVHGKFWTKSGKWYTISSLTQVQVFAYGSSSSPNDCTASSELPQKRS